MLYQTSDLQSLELEHANTLLERSNQISNLQVEIEALTRTIYDKEKYAISKDDMISDLQATKTTLMTSMSLQEEQLSNMQATVVDLRKQVEQQTLKTDELQSVIVNMKADGNIVADELSEAIANYESLSRQLQEAEISNASVWEQLAAAIEENSDIRAAWMITRTTLATMRAKIETTESALIQAKATEHYCNTRLVDKETESAALREEVDSLKSNISQLEESGEAWRSATEELRQQLATTTSNVDQLNEELHLKIGEMSNISMELKAAEMLRADLLTQIKANQDLVGSLKSEVDSAHSMTLSLQTSLNQAEAKQAADALVYERETTSLKQYLTSKDNEVAAVKLCLESTALARDDLAHQLQNTQSELSETLGALKLATTQSSALERDATSAQRKAQEIEEELNALKLLKSRDEATIASLKDIYVKLRKAQMDSFAEYDMKVRLNSTIENIYAHQYNFKCRLDQCSHHRE